MRDATDPPQPVWRWLTALLPVALFALALVALERLGGELRLRDILAAFHATEPWRVVAAVGFTAASYVVLTGYERAALSHVGVRLPWHRYALTSFVAYAIGNSLGASAVSGAALRYRLYAPLGLGAVEIGTIVAFCTVTFLLGVATLAGLSLVMHAGEAASVLHASRTLSIVVGAALLGAVASYFAACWKGGAVLRWRGWHAPLPAPRIAATQVALASTDLLLASACAYVLLPATAQVSFGVFAALYMVALGVSLVTAVPGGVGVFESLLVILLPGVPASQLLGALLAYRLVYYVAPFGVALALLTGREVAAHRARVDVALAWSRRALDLVMPQAMAVLVFGAGFLLLLSGATPGATSRLEVLGRLLPLPVLELSHLAGSAVGVLLLILARGLLLRLDGAWQVAMWLLGIGIAASLLKGLDYEEALALAAVAFGLWQARAQFYRRAALLGERLSLPWLAHAAVAVGASIWVGLLAYRHVPYAHELWWQFAFDAHAPRMLRASLLAVLLLGSFALLRLLAPTRTPSRTPTADELERVRPIVQASGDGTAHLALLGDKALLFSRSGRGFLMYGVSGRSWIAMGDPVGPAADREELVWRFRELADQAGASCVFYQVGPEQLGTYVDAGLALSKMGEEARVHLAGFSLEGSAHADLRQTHRRAQRDGLVFRIVPREEVPSIFPALQRVSTQWLDARSAREKGFSLGRFSFDYLCRFPVAVVEQERRVVAFANLWTSDTREELSIDLMRHGIPAPRGVMDYLFVELMLWGKSQGYRWFNLGMAPLAGLDQHRLAPFWHKVGRFVYRHGEDFYNFEGLRQFKEKFQPEWRPRYLAAPGRLALPRVLIEVTRLIAGGATESHSRQRATRSRARHRTEASRTVA